MNSRTVLLAIVCGTLIALAGCSESDEPAAVTAPGQAAATPRMSPANPANPASSADKVVAPSSVRIWIDGQPAQPVPTATISPGISNWRVSRPVSTSPRLRYDVTNSRLGRPNTVSVGIFRQGRDGTASPQAEYSIYSTDPDAQAEIRPGVEHALGSPRGKIGIQNASNKTVEGVRLAPGQKYLLVLNVKGNQSETAQVEFVTR